MTEDKKPEDWLDFKAIKKDANVGIVLGELGLLDALEEKGVELVGWCPLGERNHGKKDSFCFNTDTKVFQCFACKNKGSVLDFVARFEKLSLRDAGRRVLKLMAENVPDDDNLDTWKGENSDHVPAPAPTIQTDDDGSLRVTMSFQEAVLKVENGSLDPNQLQVVNMDALNELNSVFGIARSA